MRFRCRLKVAMQSAVRMSHRVPDKSGDAECSGEYRMLISRNNELHKSNGHHIPINSPKGRMQSWNCSDSHIYQGRSRLVYWRRGYARLHVLKAMAKVSQKSPELSSPISHFSTLSFRRPLDFFFTFKFNSINIFKGSVVQPYLEVIRNVISSNYATV